MKGSASWLFRISQRIHPIIAYNVQFCHHFCTDDLLTLFFNLLRQNADDIQNRLFVRMYLSEL